MYLLRSVGVHAEFRLLVSFSPNLAKCCIDSIDLGAVQRKHRELKGYGVNPYLVPPHDENRDVHNKKGNKQSRIDHFSGEQTAKVC